MSLKWEDCKVTFWLYLNGKPLTAIRAHVSATPTEVRQEAIRQHSRVPLCYPVAPYTFLMFLAMSEVRR